MKTESWNVNHCHQRRLRQFLMSCFSTKLENLLTNLDVGLCKDYDNVTLWSKVKHGGMCCAPDDNNDDDGSSEIHVGWEKFVDGNLCSTLIEKKSSYHYASPDSCVLALHNGHTSALQCSLQGLLEKEVFDNDVVQQLSEM